MAKSQNARRVGLGLLGAALLLLPGCGPPTAQLQGLVTYQGAPAGGADLMLEAKETREQYFGATGEDGKLYVSYDEEGGVPPGPYTIRVTYSTLPDGKPLPPGEEGATLRNSGRAVTKTFVMDQELAAGSNTLDLKLENARVQQPHEDTSG